MVVETDQWFEHGLMQDGVWNPKCLKTRQVFI